MIESVSNQRVKHIVKLQKSARLRRQEGCFLVEGPRMFFEVPKSRMKEVYMTEEFENRYRDRLEGYRYELISPAVCQHLSDTQTPQGVLAVVKQVQISLEDLLAKEDRHCLFVLENLQDPGNLGTIIRTAEGAGVTGIVMNKETVDVYNSKVIRSTMGAIFRVPIVIVEDLSHALQRMKEAQITVYAAHLKGGIFYGEDYKKACAFLIGNEGNGLTDQISACADRLIKIPMKGQVESLNASVAATVLMYEVMRQRDWS